MLRFTCVSDIHVDDMLNQSRHKNITQFRELVAKSYGLGYDDLFVCGGDISSYGKTKTWDRIKKIVTEAGFEHQIWTIGNHEYGTVGENSDADTDFLAFSGRDSIYYTENIGGCHFIMLAAEGVEISPKGYSDEQMEWLKAQLDACADDKPIFIISHYPAVHGNHSAKMLETLSNRKNVFFLWGHQHSLNWKKATFENYYDTSNGFVTIRMGCTHYYNSDNADALLVDIYNDRVVLTIERTDGEKLSPNSVTINLE